MLDDLRSGPPPAASAVEVERPAPVPAPAPAPAAAGTPRAAARATTFLPNVQALRAVAVLMVVTFHFWPEQVKGGFAGVDVFFVISGYLITSHLAREVDGSGRISLRRFYARRLRRLLPAALTVLLVSAAAAFLVLPVSTWPQTFTEITASALYVENWVLAAASVDYFAAENAATTAQHYWSLSVEEQFYLVWPLLLLVAAVVTRGRPARRRAVMAGVLAVVFVLSLAYSIAAPTSNPEATYFSTLSRAWEFGAGGLLALTAAVWVGRSTRRGTAALLAVLSWAGLAVIVASAFLLDETRLFPGWVALFPVAGTVAVIAAGMPAGRLSTAPLLRLRPVQFVGDISYSLYLWHWPVLVFVGWRPGSSEPTDVNRWWLLAISLVLATATRYAIENRLREGRGEGRRTLRTGRTYALAAAGMVVVCAVSGVGGWLAGQREADAAAEVRALRADPPRCFGAESVTPECAGVAVRDGVVPAPVGALSDRPKVCMQDIAVARLRVCEYGPDPADAELSIAVVGDSHAAHWMSAFQVVAKREKWHVATMVKGSCPLTDARRTSSPAEADSCEDWNAAAHRWLAEHPEIRYVVVSASSANRFRTSRASDDSFQAAVDGYVSAWNRLPASVRTVIVLRDIPRPREDVVVCSELALRRGDTVDECGLPRTTALLPDPEVTATESTRRRVEVVDLTPAFCTGDRCEPEVGGAFVYRDGHHMTATFGRSLVPQLTTQLEAAIR
jgi:peptidoglycan/LPS O-acetylase OafA/YrhL